MGAIKYEDAVREKWYRNDLDFKLHAAQKVLQETFNEARGQLFVANCSRQWGKSYWAVKIAIETALKNPKAQIRYGAAFQTDLEEFIIPAFEKILEDCPQELKPKYNAQKSAFLFRNGSRIKLVGLDKRPNGLRGNTLDLIIIDECGFVGNLDYIYKSIIVPATLHRPNCRIILISTPPSTPAHPFVEYVQKAEIEGSYVVLDIYSNPLISEGDIERMAKELGGKESTAFQRECLCRFVVEGDLAIIREWDDKYIEEVQRDEYFGYYDLYTSMDMGRIDFTALIFGHYNIRRAALVIEDELTLHGPTWTTVTLKDAILQKERELWFDEKAKEAKKVFRRIADNNNPHLILDLASIHNLSFIETTKESLEAMVNEVRFMVADGRIIVHPRCKLLIGCLKYGIWDEKRREFARSKVYGHFDHLAALIYLVRNLAKDKKIPAIHGHDNARSWVKHVKEENISPNARLLGKTLLTKKQPFKG